MSPEPSHTLLHRLMTREQRLSFAGTPPNYFGLFLFFVVPFTPPCKQSAKHDRRPQSETPRRVVATLAANDRVAQAVCAFHLSRHLSMMFSLLTIRDPRWGGGHHQPVPGGPYSTLFPVSRIAYGLPMGSELEVADAVTLARALEGRQRMS